MAPVNRTPVRPTTTPVTPGPSKARTPDEVRAQIAQWAIKQANDPNIGYSQTAGRFGDRTDSNGHRYFDCSGLCYTAYKQFGINLGGNWTGAMKDTWRSWADQVPKNLSQMKPGDLILMDGHVVMYTGDGKCVGAQTSHAAFQDQVRAGIDAQHYLNRPDAIVLRPRVSGEQVANAPEGMPLDQSTVPATDNVSSSGGGSSGGGSSSGGVSSSGGAGGRSSGGVSRSSGAPAPSFDPGSLSGLGSLVGGDDDFFLQLLEALSGDDDSALLSLLRKRFPNMSEAKLAQLASKLSAHKAEAKQVLQLRQQLQGANAFQDAKSSPVDLGQPTGQEGEALSVDANPDLMGALQAIPRSIAA